MAKGDWNNIVYLIDTICAGSKNVCTWVPPALSLVSAYVHWSALSIEHESAICNCYKYALFTANVTNSSLS